MNTKDFIRLGIPLGEATRRATDFVSQFILSGEDKTKLEQELKAIVANPALFAEDPLRKELAKAIVNAPPPPRAEPVKYRQWGEGLEHEAVMQMGKACLPGDVLRRFERGWKNFCTVYRPLADSWAVYDNSGERPQLIEKSL